ncbi:peptidase s41 family protein [Colletotrichum musicola]|uniref:Peptidase s41 family protein n=1 Tax=Colletotrichum musicola TaxID=2175873 RepID=A0A8H6N7U2_9PEZI|nr:peptidase s41 family protein [Colletotrichum musicola]
MLKLDMARSVLLILPAAALVAAGCAADNCLRALAATQTPGRLSSASAFCATFTSKPVASTAIPSFASEHCQGAQPDALSSRLSSACSCIVSETAGNSSTTVAPTSTTSCSGSTRSAGQTTSFTTVVKSSTATPSASESPTKTPTAAACAIVSSSWAVQASSRNPAPTVEAKLADDCLKSVPFHKTEALELVDSLRPYLEWQSDLAFVKNPPKDYEPGSFDVIGHLEKVRANVAADKYAGELAFQEDLFQITAKVRNGHFQFAPDALTGVFDYIRPFSLVSYSKDLLSLPVIKHWQEVVVKQDDARTVKSLNGIEASAFVQGVVNSASGNQDLDAAYNNMFVSKAKLGTRGASGNFKTGGWHRSLYPGENTTIEYTNGETETARNVAIIMPSFEGVTDGESFYQKFCKPGQLAKATAHSGGQETSILKVAALPGYPEPVVASNDNKVTGYYLQGRDFDDVAVLYVTSFDPQNPRIFQRSVELFLAQCRLDGKSKIVIDLQMNAGGFVVQGYDLFRQFFPDLVQDGFSRWRENEQFLALARIVSAATENVDPQTTSSVEAVTLWENWWNFRFDLNMTNQPFESWDAKFAPHKWAGDNYTANTRWDLSRSLTTSNESFGLGIEVTGYGTRQNFTRPFDPQNIVLLTDGFCASTCSLFASEMAQAGVKAVTFGGRPNKKPMQAVGGVKGAQVLGFEDIYNQTRQHMQSELTKVSPEQRALLSKLTKLPFQRSTSARLNVRDQILRGNINDGVPAQFVNEPAECRLFWTLPMLSDVTEIWKAAANAAWNGARCAAGAGFLAGSKGRIRKKPAQSNAAGAAGSSRARIEVSDDDIEPEYQVSERMVKKFNQRVYVL